MDFQEAGNNYGLLHSCGKMFIIEPQVYLDATTAHHCTPVPVPKSILCLKKVAGFEHTYYIGQDYLYS